MRRILYALALGLCLLVAVPEPSYAVGRESPRETFLQDINERRSCAAPLVPTGHRLLTDARAWSREMASTEFRHSTLDIDDWSRVAEVIGVASSAPELLRLLFQSAPHARILRDCRYDFMAVGFYRRDGTVWLTGRLYAA
jgi:hypothetical protein